MNSLSLSLSEVEGLKGAQTAGADPTVSAGRFYDSWVAINSFEKV